MTPRITHNTPRKLFMSSLLALALLGLAPRIHAAAPVPVVSPDDDAAYAAGSKALNERRWSDAVSSFDQVITAKGKKVDAALYWKAYALNKLNKQQLASDTCTQLHTQFKESSWNDDCRALTVAYHIDFVAETDSERIAREVDRATRTATRTASQTSVFRADQHSTDPEADIKILALNAVMRQDPTRALPLLRGILTGDQPEAVKQQAFFVLAQSKSPEAEALMRDVILGKMGPALQAQAIKSSGIYRGRVDNDALAEAYRNTTDASVKRAVISAFFISSDDAHLVELARQEKDMELKRRIVSQLSLMRGKAATDYMIELLK